jgi:CRP/FNR family transcriptional regulator, cyclic AMP receptor protein
MMARTASSAPRARHHAGFDAERFLTSTRIAKRIIQFDRGAVIYAQGAAAGAVLYIQTGRVKLSVVSPGGKEAVVAILGAGDFFGEGSLAGQRVRMSTATAMIASRVLTISRHRMRRLLHNEPAFSERFIMHILARNIRIEEDLVDRLFNSVEKRFARALMLMARYGRREGESWILPRVSQETLAEMVGTTRPRINFFMNKFRTLGFIDYNGELIVRGGLLSVVLHD